MSERFGRWNDHSCKVKDNQEGILLSWEDVVDKLNDFSEENEKLKEEWEFSFRTEMALHRVAEKELKEKIKEQQSIIEDLKKENEELKKDNSLLRKYIEGCIKHRDLYRERLINGDDNDE